MPLIQSNVSVVQWSDWFAAFSDKRAPDRFTLRFDRAHMSLDAAAQGLGVALESTTTGGKHLAEGKLRPVLGHGQVDPREGALRGLPGAPCASGRPVEAFLSWLHGEAAASSSSGSREAELAVDLGRSATGSRGSNSSSDAQNRRSIQV